MKAGKIWGQTELIHANGVLEFHRIEFKKGYKCSEHEHKFKWNGFFVESGKMIVRVWQEDQEGLVDETILEAGDFTQVKPGKVHQFEGLEDGVAFELYWAEFNHDDIVLQQLAPNITEDNMLEKLFGLSQTILRTEVMAGIATFPTMAYITVPSQFLQQKEQVWDLALFLRQQSPQL